MEIDPISIMNLILFAIVNCTWGSSVGMNRMKSVDQLSYLSGGSLYKDLVYYSEIGDHWTTSEGDVKTVEWLRKRLNALGFKTRLQPVPVKQFFLKGHSLSVDGKEIKSFPFWRPQSTGPTPVQGPFVKADSRNLMNSIALITFPFDRRGSVFPGSGYEDYVEKAVKAGAIGAVAITEGPTNEIIGFNTFRMEKAWPIPVLLVAPKDAEFLEKAAEQRAIASLLLNGEEKRDAVAHNVIGSIGSGERLIVVSTPVSGWFRCAGERGPGIAMFLAIARWISERNSGTRYMFVGTTAHELEGSGMLEFYEKEITSPEGITAWLHLGAGIATWKWEETKNGLKRLDTADEQRIVSNSPNLDSIVSKAFSDVKDINMVGSRIVLGELRTLKAFGVRSYFGVAAGSMFHHTVADLPNVTGPEILEPVARALVRILESIDKNPP